MTFIEDVADAINDMDNAEQVSILRSTTVDKPESVVIVMTDAAVYSIQIDQIASR